MQVILLRGLAREAAHWLDFPARLTAALGASCQVQLIDFPGCGQDYQQPALSSVAAMTEHARRQLNSAPSKKVYLIGISMGGMVALDWAQRFPDEVRGLVLINTSTGHQPWQWRLRPRALPSMLLALLSSWRAREARVLKLVSNNADRYKQHLQQWLAIQQQRPVSRTSVLSMLRAAAAFRPQPECTPPGLVLASERDRMVGVQASKALAAQFHWPLALHPSAGHDLPMDDPDWVVKEIVSWLEAQQ
jgi:pimeloyl-[acyl-carrier protein] methyl ester esterase